MLSFSITSQSDLWLFDLKRGVADSTHQGTSTYEVWWLQVEALSFDSQC